MMKILSLELSSTRRSVAVWDPMAMTHPIEAMGDPRPDRSGMGALGLVDGILGKAGWDRRDVTLIAIGVGPGSLTGVRAAISLAQGWQFATGVRLRKENSVSLIAAELFEAGVRGAGMICFDGQRGEVYGASLEIQNAGPSVPTALGLVSASDLHAATASGVFVCGPDLDRVFAEAKPAFPSASSLARLCAREGCVDQFAYDLAPVYLRDTQFVKIPGRASV